jgi:hypothetical protein
MLKHAEQAIVIRAGLPDENCHVVRRNLRCDIGTVTLSDKPDELLRNDSAPHGGGGPVAALEGLGGHIILWPDRIEIERHGMLFSLLNLGYHLEREIASTFYLRELVGVHLVRSFTLVQFLRFTYAGCPTPTGHYLRDAFAENAFMLSLRDNRPLLGFMRSINEAMAASPPRGEFGRAIR